MKAELKTLTETAMLTRNSLNESAVSYEQDFCPFCGRARDKRKLGGRTFYTQCDCEENRAAVEEWSKLLEREKDLAEAVKRLREELERQEAEARKLLEESDLGRRFRDRTFETFREEDFPEAYRTALEYAENFESNEGEGLLFTGTPGTGKTHLAAAIANRVMTEFGEPVRFGGFVDLLEKVKRAFGTDEDVIRQLSEARLLVIDDLGKERRTEWSDSILYQVINRRYENYLPVVITTNEDMGDLERNIGAATLSRLIETCKGVRMEGKDHRKEKLK